MRLLDYIRGLRKGKEAHRLEKESMKDAFLADTMNEYQQVSGNHEQRIEQLKRQVSIRCSKKRNTYAVAGSIACLLIGFGVTNLIAKPECSKKRLDKVVESYVAQNKSTATGSVVSSSKEIKEEKLRPSDPLIGRHKYKEYLEENLIYPTDKECKGVKGNVTLSFFVDTKGNPYRIVVIKGLCKSADKEAIRLIKEGPKWTKSILPVKIKVKF